MLQKETVTVAKDEEILTAKQCDKCKIVFPPSDYVEWQEFIHISMEGGYGSVWGDGIEVKVDLCQRCGLDLFKDFAQTEDVHGVPPGMP